MNQQTDFSSIALKALVPLLMLAAALVLLPVTTTTNTVAATKAGDQTQAEGANDLKPANCDAQTLTALVNGGTGTNANELMLGTNAGDTMNGQGGTDCILGGNGVDNINGGAGTDICLGGPGVDLFTSCETQVQ